MRSTAAGLFQSKPMLSFPINRSNNKKACIPATGKLPRPIVSVVGTVQVGGSMCHPGTSCCTLQLSILAAP